MNRISSGLLIFVGAVALALSANYSFWWYLSLIGLVPLFYIIYDSKVSSRAVFLFGWLYGGVYLFVVHLTSLSTLPLDWAGIPGPIAGYALILYSNLFTVIVLSFFVGLWAFGCRYFRWDNWLDILLAPFLWIVFEYCRAWAYAITTYGPGGLLGPTWSIGFLGYNLAPSQLFLPLAGLGGVWLLGFVAVAFNLAVYFGLRVAVSTYRREKFATNQLFFVVATIVVSLAVSHLTQAGLEAPKSKEKHFSFAIANTHNASYYLATPEKIEASLKKLKELISGLSKERLGDEAPDIVVLPEDSRFLWYLAGFNERDFIKDIFMTEKPVLFIDSERAPNQSGSFNLRFTYVNNLTGQYGHSGKTFLFPHGEYIPYVSRILLPLLGRGEWVRGFEGIRGNRPGEYDSGFNHEGTYIEATACADLLLPFLYSQTVDRGAGFLLNSASHALFNGSPVLFTQTVNMSKVRAVETNRFFIYAANFTPSFVLDNYGNLVVQSKPSVQEEGFIFAEVPILSQETIYQKWYRYLTLIFILGLVLIFIFRLRNTPSR